MDYLDADITSYEEGKKWCVEKGVVRARVAMGADEPLSEGVVSETAEYERSPTFIARHKPGE